MPPSDDLAIYKNKESREKVVTGKAGTAIFGDTYALHHGNPLNEGGRLLFWARYCIKIIIFTEIIVKNLFKKLICFSISLMIIQ